MNVNEVKSPHKRKHYSTQSAVSESNEACATKATSAKGHGPRGDPRMNKAVEARMKNPQISLLEALVVGGFKFPTLQVNNGNKKNGVVDEDNVLLSQRKNQLSRRIRIAKKKYHAEANHGSIVSNSSPIFNVTKTEESAIHSATQIGSLSPMAMIDTSSLASLGHQSLLSSAAVPAVNFPPCGILNALNSYRTTLLIEQQLQSELYIRSLLQHQISTSQVALNDLNQESIQQYSVIHEYLREKAKRRKLFSNLMLSSSFSANNVTDRIL
mmetsp:Transcript_6322/g.6829  ORF Transcript_6322/g.6829 Transcript_6322/m.6829 type:complete len:269 (+) Transcript_6322:91-897(+)